MLRLTLAAIVAALAYVGVTGAEPQPTDTEVAGPQRKETERVTYTDRGVWQLAADRAAARPSAAGVVAVENAQTKSYIVKERMQYPGTIG